MALLIYNRLLQSYFILSKMYNLNAKKEKVHLGFMINFLLRRIIRIIKRLS